MHFFINKILTSLINWIKMLQQDTNESIIRQHQVQTHRMKASSSFLQSTPWSRRSWRKLHIFLQPRIPNPNLWHQLEHAGTRSCKSVDLQSLPIVVCKNNLIIFINIIYPTGVLASKSSSTDHVVSDPRHGGLTLGIGHHGNLHLQQHVR